jgi:hypothetical protein
VNDLAMIQNTPDAEALLLKMADGALDPIYMQYMLLPESTRTRLAWFRLKRRDIAAAEKLLDEAERVSMEHWRAGVQAAGLPVELAAIHAMRGNADEAANWMQRAYDLGWRERLQFQADPMLASALSHPRLKALMKQIEEDIRRKAAESREVKLLFETTVPALPPSPRAAIP